MKNSLFKTRMKCIAQMKQQTANQINDCNLFEQLYIARIMVKTWKNFLHMKSFMHGLQLCKTMEDCIFQQSQKIRPSQPDNCYSPSSIILQCQNFHIVHALPTHLMSTSGEYADQACIHSLDKAALKQSRHCVGHLQKGIYQGKKRYRNQTEG